MSVQSFILFNLQLLQPTVDENLQKTQALIINANAKYAELQEPIPQKLQEQLEKMDTLHSGILQSTKDKQKQLEEAVTLREELKGQSSEVKEWLDEAKKRLEEAQEGVDYEKGHEKLQDHKVCVKFARLLPNLV